MAFLEYLGMWDETDEDWLLLEDETPAKDEEQERVPKPRSVEASRRRKMKVKQIMDCVMGLLLSSAAFADSETDWNNLSADQQRGVGAFR